MELKEFRKIINKAVNFIKNNNVSEDFIKIFFIRENINVTVNQVKDFFKMVNNENFTKEYGRFNPEKEEYKVELLNIVGGSYCGQ